MRKFIAVTVAIAALMTASNVFAEGGKAFTDAKKAGKDYKIQGEYVGEVDGMKIGAQCIALGKGKFELNVFFGGLPGDGWERDGQTIKAKGETDGDKVVFRPTEGADDPNGKGVLKDGVMEVYNGDGQKILEMKKKVRKSPTLGKKPPKGAVVLFDGKTADTFEKGKLVEEKLLGATNCSSKEKLGDHHMHIEFRTPFMPESKGQARGNSGVYVQSRYEVQVLDSFGLEGKNNECGGIYSIGEPKVNMCLPPLTWQTYDIDFTAAKYEEGKKVKNARVTIKHNGVTIHDNIELPNGTPGCKKEGASPEGVFLQNHGNPVAFRNIWVIKK